MSEYKIQASSHTYVTLTYGDRFIRCYDNDQIKGEDIIEQIEKRTRMKITDIPIIGTVQDFDGFFFRGKSGWHNLLASK